MAAGSCGPSGLLGSASSITIFNSSVQGWQNVRLFTAFEHGDSTYDDICRITGVLSFSYCDRANGILILWWAQDPKRVRFVCWGKQCCSRRHLDVPCRVGSLSPPWLLRARLLEGWLLSKSLENSHTQKWNIVLRENWRQAEYERGKKS